MPRTAWIALALAAFCALAGALWSWQRSGAAPDAPDPEALRLFERKLPDADGVERPLATWKGKLLVVNFWATWCTPCVEEMPELQRFADEFAGRNIAVVGIGVDDADKIREFRRQHQLRIPLLAAGFDGMELARQLGNPQPVLPYTALISPDSRIVEEHSGRLEPAELRKWAAEYAHP
jgi:thiol-disulfide isomerase/thioredoxin